MNDNPFKRNKFLKPYKHDCTKCKWVSWLNVGGRLINMYICEGKTIVLRYSSIDSDYTSYSVGDIEKTEKLVSANELKVIKEREQSFKE